MRYNGYIFPQHFASVSIEGGITKMERLVLGGERAPAAEGKTFAVLEPGSGKPFAEVAEAGTQDVERAVQSAHRAFEEGRWPRLSATERGRILLRASTLV